MAMQYATGRDYFVYEQSFRKLMQLLRRRESQGPEDLGCRTCASKLLWGFLMSDADAALQNAFSCVFNGLT